MNMEKEIAGCIIGGAIGDAWGSVFENLEKKPGTATFYLTPQPEPVRGWAITDDTQMTLATCEAIMQHKTLTPALLADKFFQYYKQKRLTGVGSSTLKALRELEIGGHWSQVGRSGEYAAGNGAAMRIAPFAFLSCSREEIRDYCRITHRNDEAYAGALAVIIAIRAVVHKQWSDKESLLNIIIADLPDTRVRDRLIEISSGMTPATTIAEVASMGTGGYVVDSVPFALFAASKIRETSFESILREVIDAGGDTDTNASIAGQVAGSYVTIDRLPLYLLEKLQALQEYPWIEKVTNAFSSQR